MCGNLKFPARLSNWLRRHWRANRAGLPKTLSFWVGNKPILVVSAGDARIDNSKYKAQFGTKAKMLTPEETLTQVGHAVGGVCPFAVNENVTVYLDKSLQRFETVFPAVREQ